MLCRSAVRRQSSAAPAARSSRTVPKASARPQLPPRTDVARVRIPELQWSIENVEGKRLSIAIFTHLAENFGGKLSIEAAQEGLKLYGEDIVQDARQRPGAHPNIDLLFRVIGEDSPSLELLVDRQ
ncbi:hypothetical protein VOLCADRAFT_105806 [Volvox carteri f. nagariensis]|uniref:DUF2322 family protein n=1 Tax=Volvox carteri f. nagariensis TaxID=3068 RepID=D8U386_VOLCA|nr:uncharacterized protein VOLCADRAFT_105806 [Volvox carteri f. nagariensis]EFJ45709.1 hypothetical protein VOLCADRAFT_105806 [Volvox carteri f. nagariensis]|eukprot:XP_002953110.1 hypothetical protein VOLCADRAFT_105806 [Volvox carteri f. nagariensis]